MIRTSLKLSCVALIAILSLLAADFANAHHVLGRPGYSLNEDSNTPPAVQGETHIDDFIVTYMVFPAFPRPHEPGRVNLYLKHDQGEAPFKGRVTFKIRGNSWLSWLWGDEDSATLGTQAPDDSVFRQGFVFPDNGDYIVSAEFEAGGKPYNVEFPLRVGTPTPMGFVFGFVLLALVVFVAIQRRRAMTGKLRDLHTNGGKP